MNSNTTGKYGDYAGVLVEEKGKLLADIPCIYDPPAANQLEAALPDFLSFTQDQ